MAAKKSDPVAKRADAVFLKLLDAIEKQIEASGALMDPVSMYEQLCRAEGARRGSQG